MEQSTKCNKKTYYPSFDVSSKFKPILELKILGAVSRAVPDVLSWVPALTRKLAALRIVYWRM